jgi:predicted RNA methylase
MAHAAGLLTPVEDVLMFPVRVLSCTVPGLSSAAPAAGNLTMKLLERAKKVIAIELDPRMVRHPVAAAAAAAMAGVKAAVAAAAKQ